MKNLSLVNTIIILAITLFTIQLISSLSSIIRINTMGVHIQEIAGIFMPLTKNTTLITEHQLAQEIEFERVFRFALIADARANKNFKHAVQAFNSLNSSIEKELNESHHLLELATEELTDENALAQIAELKKINDWIEKHHADWVVEVEKTFALLALGKTQEVKDLAEHIETEAVALEKQVTGMLKKIELFTEESLHNLKSEEEYVLMVAGIILLISFIVTLLATRYVTKNVSQNISELRDSIARISKGDLVTKVTSSLSKEFGINLMRQSLYKTLSIVESSSHKMLHASNELAQVSADVSKTIDQQALQIEQISSAMTEMEATSVEVAHHAESTKASTLCATEQVLESKATIENAMNLISQLTISLESSSNNIKELETHSGQISSVLNVINGIADQTNLLALNAAIEAARAGEQGRGFAVVADEVRNLAKRTQESTIEVENMIGLFTRGTSEAVLSMSQSTIQGNSSKTATQDTNNIISDIQSAIHEINDMNDQIATAAEEQSCTSKELSRNTISINQLSNDNLLSVSQISKASEELAQISMQLKEQLSQFTLS